MRQDTLELLLFIGGVGHIALAFGSLLIPRMLNWHGKLANVHGHIRQMFWTYAAYTFGIHIFFGVISLVAAEDLLDGSPLAFAMTFFITIYWFLRLVLQFTVYDRSAVSQKIIFRLGEWILVLLFVLFVTIYGMATYHNMT